MFDNKRIVYILILLSVLIVGMGVSSATDMDTNNLELDDNSTDLNLTSIADTEDVSLDNSLESQLLVTNNEDTNNGAVSHNHKSLSSINQVPKYLNSNFDLITSVTVAEQISNYLNYTVTITDDSIIGTTGPVTVDITLPSNVGLVSTLPGGATATATGITWNIPSILSGDKTELNFIVNVTSAGQVNVTANATPNVGDTDVDLTNNYDEVVINAITYLSFTALKELIDNNIGSYVHIANNYAYDFIIDGDKFSREYGIDINTTVYIINDGTYKISGANVSKVFTVRASDVTFDKLIITNGRSQGGAAITSTSEATNLRVDNSIFKDNLINGNIGGAISIGGNNSQVTDSTFINNAANSEGGAIAMVDVTDVKILRSVFEDNYVAAWENGGGGAIAVLNSKNVNVSYNAFINNANRAKDEATTLYESGSTNVDFNENWWGTNFPNFTNTVLVAGGTPVTSWVILRYELVDGSMSIATTHATWYVNNTLGIVSKLNTAIATRSISYNNSNSPASYFLTYDSSISSDAYAAFFYGTYVPDCVFYIAATVDNQTCPIEFTTILNITKTVDTNVSVAGDTFQYNLTIINKGPNNAYNVDVTDLLPNNVVVNDTTGLIINGKNVSYSIPVIAPDTNYTILLIVYSNVSGTHTNTMNVSSTNKYNYFLNNITYANVTIIPGVDLEIVIEYDNASYIGEANYNFTINITNHGPSTANGVEVFFKVPDGMEYLTYTPITGGGTYSNTTGLWTGISPIPSGTTYQLRVFANATQAGTFNSTANVTLNSTSTVNETKLHNNEYNVSVFVSDNIDLIITINANTTDPLHKSQVNLTITVKNNGPAPANNISVKIDIPSDLIYDYDNSTGLYNYTTGIWNISSLVRNQEVSIFIICNADVIGNFTVNATAYNNTENDTNLTNNYAELNITVIPHADLSVFINVTNTTPGYNPITMTNITYTIRVYNGGLDNATNVTVNFTIPNGFVYIEHTPGLDYNETTGIWNVSDLLFNTTKEINITVGINTTGNITAFVNVTGNENDTYIPNNTANISVYVYYLVDLSINKTVNITGTLVGSETVYYANDGDNVTYTLEITNNGPCNATDVIVTDYITNLTNIVANASGVYNPITKNITWNIGNLNSGQTVYVHFNATIKTINSTLFNNATVTSNINESDTNITNNIDNITLTINHRSDLEIILNISNTTPPFYDFVNLTVTVINHGPSVAFDTNVTLEIPNELTWKNDNSSGAYNSATKVWNIGRLDDGDNITIWILLNVTSLGNFTINGTVNSTINDTNITNNNATVNLSSVYSDVEIIILVPNTNIAYSDVCNLTVKVINHGPSIALDVNVTLEIPAGLIHDNDNSSGAYNSLTKVWNVGNIASGNESVIWITFNVTTIGNLTLNATVNNSINDINKSNNNATLNLSAFESADVKINITTNITGDIYMEDPFTIWITVVNMGPSNATNVNVTFVLPAGLKLLAENSSGAYDNTTGLWTIGNLSSGETRILELNVTTTTAKTFYLNTTVNATEDDVNLTNNYDNITINVIPVFDLVITVTPNFTKARVGDEITLTINVTNYGPSNATNVIVEALYSGTFTGGSNYWNIGNVSVGETKIFTLKVNATTLGDYEFFFNVTAPGNDSNKSNNNCTVNVSIVEEVNLAITVTVDNSTPTVWNNVTYTITVSNIAHSNATGVYVNVPLPSSLVYLYEYVASGEYNHSSGLWYIGNLSEGNSTSLIITCRVVSPGFTRLTGTVDSYEYDVNLSDNTDYADINAVDAPLDDAVDLVLNITVNTTDIYVGKDVDFIFNLTNKGPANATNVQVFIEKPAGLDYVSSSGSVYPINSTTLLWVVGPLDAGNDTILNITFKPTVVSILTVSGNATCNQISSEFNITDNYDSVTITPNTASDLEVNITANPVSSYIGDLVVFTITVTNIGSGPATNVVVRTDLPSVPGETWVESAPAFTPVTGEGCGKWMLWNPLAAGDSATLNITINTSYLGVGFHDYKVNVTADVDINSSNDKNNVTIEVKAPCDLNITIVANVTEAFTGEKVKFTVTAQNNGVGDAEDVYVYLDFPTSVEYTKTAGTYDTKKGIWKIGTIVPTGVAVLEVEFSLNTEGFYVFTANGTTKSSDIDLTNNNDTCNLTIKPDYDLIVTITANTTNVSLGKSVLFTVTVNNTGLTTAENVKVWLTIPNSATVVGTPTNGTYNTIARMWDIGNVSYGQVLELNLTYTPSAVGVYTYNATVNGTGSERNKTNNNGSVTINVTNLVDLSINITVDNATPSLGGKVNYTVNVTNVGDVTATNIIIDKTFVGTPLSYTAWVVWPMLSQIMITTLAPGASEVITFEDTITRAGEINENVTIIACNEGDSVPSNNISTVYLNVSSATDLEVLITVNNNTPQVGDIVNFTVTVRNIGSVNATGVKVSTNLPKPVTYTYDTGAYNPITGMWIIGALANGSEVILNVSVNITQLGFQEYNASVSLSNEDTNITNNNATVNLTSLATTDLEVLIFGDTEYYVGNSTTFTIFVVNHGSCVANNVNVTVTLPEDTFTTPSKGTYSTGLWEVGVLNVGENATLNISRTIVLSDAGIYTVNVIGDEFEFITDNNNASINITVKTITDLGVTISTDKLSYVYGEDIIYTITVFNNGPSDISNGNVSLTLPVLSNIAYNLTTNGYFDPSVNVWYLTNTLLSGKNVTLTIKANTTETGDITSSATVESSIYEEYLDNNTANCTYYIEPAANVRINMTTIPSIFNPDGSVGFIITIENLGPCDAVNASVNLSFPYNVEYTSTAGFYDPVKGVWFVPSLPYTQVETLIVNINLTNFTQIFYGNISTDIYDPNMTNNYAFVNLSVQPRADLMVTITANVTNITMGETIMFTINATNLGPCIAQGVEVYVNLPATEDFNKTAGLFDTDNGKWTIGTIPIGGSEFLYVNITFNESLPGDYTFVTNITGNVNDTVTTNNNDSITITITPVTDIEITITSNFTEAIAGDSVSFNVTVRNIGNYNDTNVVVKFIYPSDLGSISVLPDLGTLNWPIFDEWTIPTLNAGENYSAIITTTVLSNGTFNFTVTVNGTLRDENLTNNVASLIYNVTPTVDLKVTLTSTNTSQYIGGNVTFAITVENIGTNTAKDVVLSTNISKGVSVKTKGIYDGDSGLWYIGELTPTETVELNITIVTSISGEVIYVAKVNTTSKDLNENNNNASINLTGLDVCDLEITVSVNDEAPYLNDYINYTIKVKNIGDSVAYNVNVSTNLTNNLFGLIGYDTGYNPSTDVWTVGNINPGETKTLTIKFRTNNSGTFTNTFNASSDTYEINLDNNLANLTVVVDTKVRPNFNTVDLLVTLSVSNATPCVNTTIEFNVTVINNGSITAHDIVVTNYLPGTFIPDSGYTGVWNFAQLEAGKNITFTFSANVSDVYGSYVDNITVSSTELDSLPINNQANVLIILSEEEFDCIDLEVNATVIESNLTINGSITYNITIANYGPDMAFDVNSSVNLNNGVGLVIDNWTCSVGTFDPSTCIWSAGDLDVTNATNTVIINMILKLNITSAGYYVNHWSVWDDDVDLNPLNNNYIDIFWVNETIVDVGVRINANTTVPYVNNTVLFEVTVYNSGTLPATNVTVNLTLPSNMANVTSVDSNFNTTTFSYYVGDLAAGSKFVFYFNATFNTSVSSVVKVSVNSTEEDRYLDNNVDTLTINTQEPLALRYADLEIIYINVSNTHPAVGSSIRLYVTVKNNGPDVANNVIVKLDYPLSCAPTSGSPGVDSLGIYHLDSLNPGDNRSFYVDIDILAEDTFVLTESALSDEIDTNSSNNVKSVGIASYVIKPDIDLGVNVTVNTELVNINDTITYTIIVYNNGNDTAHNVSVKNFLSDGLNITNHSHNSLWTGDGWFINSLKDHSSIEFTVTANVTSIGVLLFNTKVNCSEDDKDPTNNGGVAAIYSSPVSTPSIVHNTTITLTMVKFDNIGIYNQINVGKASYRKVNVTLKDDEGNVLSGFNVVLTFNSTSSDHQYVQGSTGDDGSIILKLEKSQFPESTFYDFTASFSTKIINGVQYNASVSDTQRFNVIIA